MKSMIEFVVEMCKIILTEDYRKQSSLLCFLFIDQFGSQSLDNE